MTQWSHSLDEGPGSSSPDSCMIPHLIKHKEDPSTPCLHPHQCLSCREWPDDRSAESLLSCQGNCAS